MDFHRYKCECGHELSATGPRSLCMFVRAHEGLDCSVVARPYKEKTDIQILSSPGYRKPPGASAYDEQPLVVPHGGPIWTMQDYDLLADLRISALADLRGPSELATRYKPRHTETK